MIPSCKIHIPRTVHEALELAQKYKEQFSFIAGGTDLLVNSKDELNTKPHLISLTHIESLRKLSSNSIGSAVTLADIYRNRKILPRVIGDTIRMIAGPALREAATIGGNVLLTGRCVYFNQSPLYRCSRGACMKAEGDACIAVPQKERCYANFSSDLTPVLIALGARYVIEGFRGSREVHAAEFYLSDGIKSNQLEESEILTQIILPEGVCNCKASYQKLRARGAMDFPEAGVAIVIKGNPAAEIVVSFGALGPSPISAALLKDEINPAIDELTEKIWKKLVPEVAAVKNASFSPRYRRDISKLFLRRGLTELLL